MDSEAFGDTPSLGGRATRHRQSSTQNDKTIWSQMAAGQMAYKLLFGKTNHARWGRASSKPTGQASLEPAHGVFFNSFDCDSGRSTGPRSAPWFGPRFS